VVSTRPAGPALSEAALSEAALSEAALSEATSPELASSSESASSEAGPAAAAPWAPALAGPAPAAPADDPVEAVDLDLALLAVRIMDTTKRDVREVADEEGLSTAQLDVLRRLRHHGPTPMRRLAERLNCEASNLTGLVDRLEIRGLVERRPDPGDRRVRLLALTDEGNRVSQASWVAVARRCRLTSLGPDQRVQLARLLGEALGRADSGPETP
jgi:DNA-binding MarR family transcriptional regulator